MKVKEQRVTTAIDLIEARIRKQVPQAKLIYVEPDLLKTLDQQTKTDAEIFKQIEKEEKKMMNTMKCIVCRKELKPLFGEDNVFIQPLGGVEFSGTAVYGSKHDLEPEFVVVICDECITANQDTKTIIFSRQGTGSLC